MNSPETLRVRVTERFEGDDSGSFWFEAGTHRSVTRRASIYVELRMFIFGNIEIAKEIIHGAKFYGFVRTQVQGFCAVGVMPYFDVWRARVDVIKSCVEMPGRDIDGGLFKMSWKQTGRDVRGFAEIHLVVEVFLGAPIELAFDLYIVMSFFKVYRVYRNFGIRPWAPLGRP